MDRRLLVTGAGGFLGWQLCRQARKKWRVFGIYLRNRPQVSGIVAVKCDLASGRELEALFESIRPQAVVHAAAVSRPASCRRDPDSSFKINVEAAGHLAGLCAAAGVPLVHVSTDLVFEGSKGPYKEDDPPCPLTVYGRQKALAENLVLRQWPRAAVCRLPLLFGWAPGKRANFTMEVIERLAGGRPVPMFVDQYRSPLDTKSAARGLLKFLGAWQGHLHLGGEVRVSRYRMGLMIASLMGCSPDLVNPVRMEDFPGAEKPVFDVSLDSRAAFNAGFRPATLAEGLRETIDATLEAMERTGK